MKTSFTPFLLAMYSPIGSEIWYELNDVRKMYGLLQDGVQLFVVRVRAFPPAFVSM